MSDERRQVWIAQPRQRAFMARSEYECLYGGAAGGGKSDALIVEALRQISIPNYRGLILRRTYPQLEALISRSHELYPQIVPGARYNSTEHRWRFPSGASVFFGSMQREDDKYQYQGKPYDFIAFDELTHFSQAQYMYLMSRNRPTGAGTQIYIRATANPGGVGHAWVKARFIDSAPPMTPITDTYQVVKPDGGIVTMTRQRIFVPSTVFDNQALLANDPNYLATLASLPEAERQALLYGDWSSFEGQVFREWRDDPTHYKDGLWTHVIEPFRIPDHWVIWRGFDFGYAKPFSVGWFAADERGKLYRIREFYGCTNTPNTGVQMHPAEIARNIREIEETDPQLRGHRIMGVADPSIFDESRGQSVAQMMSNSPNFILWTPGDNHRIPGWQQYHYRLAFDDRGECKLQVFNSCRAFIRTVPALVYDEHRVEDVDTSLEDHVADEARYVLMENPISPPLPAKVAPKPFDPLATDDVHVFR